MNLTKFFVVEIVCGILLLSFFITCLFIPANHFIMIVVGIANVILVLNPVTYIYRKKQDLHKEEILVLEISLTISSIIFLIVMVLFLTLGSNLKTFSGELLQKYLPFFLAPLFILLRSTLGIFLTNIEFIKNKIKNHKKSLNEVFNSDSYIEMNKSFFGLIFLIGIFFFFFAYYQVIIGRSFVFLTPILIGGQYYDYRSKIKNKLKREFDEREKFLLFKTLSFAGLIFIIALSILFYLNDIIIFGYKINVIWGVLIFPLFLLSWGIVGLIIVRNE
ncbi:MAG: hypothetical protein NTZ27_09175 [Ignavibacteriales bacterium]|nr:hypothetical protein [Ignavibacteriales bacterium]